MASFRWICRCPTEGADCCGLFLALLLPLPLGGTLDGERTLPQAHDGVGSALNYLLAKAGGLSVGIAKVAIIALIFFMSFLLKTFGM